MQYITWNSEAFTSEFIEGSGINVSLLLVTASGPTNTLLSGTRLRLFKTFTYNYKLLLKIWVCFLGTTCTVI